MSDPLSSKSWEDEFFPVLGSTPYKWWKEHGNNKLAVSLEAYMNDLKAGKNPDPPNLGTGKFAAAMKWAAMAYALGVMPHQGEGVPPPPPPSPPPPGPPPPSPPPPPPSPPPSGALLQRTPPGYIGGDPRDRANYPGYQLATPSLNSSGYPNPLNLTDGINYFVNLGKLEWSSYPYTTSGQGTNLNIRGGNNVVIVGGEILFHPINAMDDMRGILIDGGNSGGQVYMEGVKITGCNGITLRSPRDLVVQYCHVSVDAYAGDYSHIHPDIIQIWDGNAYQSEIFQDYFTGHTWYTALTCLIQQPTRWKRYHTDIHKHRAGYAHYLSPGSSAITCYYDGGSSNWLDMPFNWVSGVIEQLPQAIDSPDGGWVKPYYQILQNGVLYPSSPTNNPNYFATGPGPRTVGNRQGDEWRCTNLPNVSERWKWGKPTSGDGAVNGEFVPAASVGVGYVPVGYAV